MHIIKYLKEHKWVTIGLIGLFVLMQLIFASNINAYPTITEDKLRYINQLAVNRTDIVQYMPTEQNNFLSTYNDNPLNYTSHLAFNSSGIFNATYTFENESHSASSWGGFTWTAGGAGNYAEITHGATHAHQMHLYDTHTSGVAMISHLVTYYNQSNTGNISFWAKTSTILPSGYGIFSISDGSWLILALLVRDVAPYGKCIQYLSSSSVWTYLASFQPNLWYYFSISWDSVSDTLNIDLNRTRVATSISYQHSAGMPLNMYWQGSDTNPSPIELWIDAVDFSSDGSFYYLRNYNETTNYYMPAIQTAKWGKYTSFIEDSEDVDYLFTQFLLAKSYSGNHTLFYNLRYKTTTEDVMQNLTIMISENYMQLNGISAPIGAGTIYYQAEGIGLNYNQSIQIDVSFASDNMYPADLPRIPSSGGLGVFWFIQIIQDRTNITQLIPLASNYARNYMKSIYIGYIGQPYFNGSLPQNLLKSRILVEVSAISTLWEGAYPSGDIETFIWRPFVPIPDITEKPYWTYQSWILEDTNTESVFIGNADFNWTTNFTHNQAVTVENKFYYDDDTSAMAGSWGDWGLFNFLRDFFAFIINYLWVGIQYIGYLLVVAFNYLLMGLIIAIIAPFIWNFLIYYLWIGLNWLGFAMVLILMNAPLILSALLYVMAIVIAGIIWGLSFGSLDFNTVLNQINNVMQFIGNYIVELVDVFISNIDAFALYAIYYCVMVGLLYFKVIYCKARGFTNRASKLNESLDSYIVPIKFTIGLVSEVKDIVSPFS